MAEAVSIGPTVGFGLCEYNVYPTQSACVLKVTQFLAGRGALRLRDEEGLIWLLPQRWLRVFCPPCFLVGKAMAARSSRDRMLTPTGTWSCSVGEVGPATSQAFVMTAFHGLTLRSSAGAQQAW